MVIFRRPHRATRQGWYQRGAARPESRSRLRCRRPRSSAP